MEATQYISTPLEAAAVVTDWAQNLGWSDEEVLRAAFDVLSMAAHMEHLTPLDLSVTDSELFESIPAGRMLVTLSSAATIVFPGGLEGARMKRSVQRFTEACFASPLWCRDTSVPLPSDAVELFAEFHAATREVAPRTLLVVSDAVLLPLFGASAVTYQIPPKRRVRFLNDDLGHCSVAPAPVALRR